MNAAQRRKSVKGGRLRENLKMVLEAAAEVGNDQLRAGDKVRLNVEQMQGRKDWKHKQADYKQFVEENRDRLFTVKLHRQGPDKFPTIVELEEEPVWLFWYGDLIPVDKE